MTTFVTQDGVEVHSLGSFVRALKLANDALVKAEAERAAMRDVEGAADPADSDPWATRWIAVGDDGTDWGAGGATSEEAMASGRLELAEYEESGDPPESRTILAALKIEGPPAWVRAFIGGQGFENR